MASKGPSLALVAPRRAEGYDGPYDGRLSGGRRPHPRPGYARPVSLCLNPAAARTRVSSADLGTTFEQGLGWPSADRRPRSCLLVFFVCIGDTIGTCRGLR